MTGVYYVPLAFHCIYGLSNEGGEDEDVKEGSEILVGGEMVKIGWPLVCR